MWSPPAESINTELDGFREQLCNRPCAAAPPPSLPPSPGEHPDFPLQPFFPHSLLYLSPHFQQAFPGNPQATQAKEADSLTADLCCSLLSSKSNPPYPISVAAHMLWPSSPLCLPCQQIAQVFWVNLPSHSSCLYGPQLQQAFSEHHPSLTQKQISQ